MPGLVKGHDRQFCLGIMMTWAWFPVPNFHTRNFCHWHCKIWNPPHACSWQGAKTRMCHAKNKVIKRKSDCRLKLFLDITGLDFRISWQIKAWLEILTRAKRTTWNVGEFFGAGGPLQLTAGIQPPSSPRFLRGSQNYTKNCSAWPRRDHLQLLMYFYYY